MRRAGRLSGLVFPTEAGIITSKLNR